MDPKSTPCTIRIATISDAAEIARQLTLLGHPTSAQDIANRWENWTAEGNSCFVAQKSDGTLAGVITLHKMHVLHRPRPVGRITALVVDDTLRGTGLGRALVEAAEKSLAHGGCGLLELTSNARRLPAHAFYEHLEYERTSVRFAKVLLE